MALKDAVKRKYGAGGSCGSKMGNPHGGYDEGYMVFCEMLKEMGVPKAKHKDIYEMMKHVHSCWHADDDADVEVKIGM